MKINQAEELAGITKKNIRFYEEQGLIRPGRDPGNGYREYTLSDVEQLKRVKLLRSLDVPCEKIREMTEGKLSLKKCMEDQEIFLKHRQDDMKRMQEMCAEISSGASGFNELKTDVYFETMKKLEEGGAQFMNANRTDVSRSRRGAIIAAAVFLAIMAAYVIIILWGNSQDPLPVPVLIFILLIPAAVAAGVIIALRQRIKEIKGGELDDARKY